MGSSVARQRRFIEHTVATLVELLAALMAIRILFRHHAKMGRGMAEPQERESVPVRNTVPAQPTELETS
jgi:hypothetical protein